MNAVHHATYSVAVRTLCEFTAKAGDLDLRFTPSATALEGTAGHSVVAARRAQHIEGYEVEVSLSGSCDGLTVRGRADGYDPTRQRIEEVKTYRGDIAAMPANRRALHWAQVQIYGALLCAERGLIEVELALVYFDVATQDETVLTGRHTAAALQQMFEQRCQRFRAWAAQEAAHRHARDAALTALRFAHTEFRAGQRPLSEAVYKAATGGRCLIAQAPTGIGKTIGTLFPLLKACPPQRIDKVFFLTAKTPGRALALDALQVIRGSATAALPSPKLCTAAAPLPNPEKCTTAAPLPNPEVRATAATLPNPEMRATAATLPNPEKCATAAPLRVLELVAREKSCEHPDKACHGDSCPLARGFYDRLAAARADAVSRCATEPAAMLDRATLREVALAHAICPYYLSQELVRWCDVVVGDYHHWFDMNAMLHGLTQAHEWRVGLLVDEAHNLIERGRSMYSATLRHTDLSALLTKAPAELRPALRRLDRAWLAIEDTQTAGESTVAYRAYTSVRPDLAGALQQVVSVITDHLAERPAADSPLLRFYFDALHFTRVLESFGDHSLFDVTLEPASASASASSNTNTNTTAAETSVLCLRNLVPAPFLKPRFAAAHTATLFSATLNPVAYITDLLGLPDNTAHIDVESPFEARQLRVEVARSVSTRYPHRADSLAPIVALMAAQYARAPGNYLAFFSSFDYLQQVAGLLRTTHPMLVVWEQSRAMDEAARAQFLARFTPISQGIGFAVLGGAFAEGIDLPGQRLIGAFIATLGLPQVNPVNEQVKARMEHMFGSGRGHDYAYLYPGVQKVVQAAGRVIRSPTDRGVVVLIDDRYTRPQVQRLLPRWWALVPA